MNAGAAWFGPTNPLFRIERKWIETGTIEPEELSLLRIDRAEHSDVRFRETSRVLIAAIEGRADGEPHAQRLLVRRHAALFRSKVRKSVAAA